MLGLGSPLHQQHQSPKPQKPRYKGLAAERRAVTSHNSSTRDGLRETTEGRPLGEEVFTEKVTLGSTLRNMSIWMRREGGVAGTFGAAGDTGT